MYAIRSYYAFVVFSDASLAEMAALMPKDEKEFLRINGVGEHKLKRYGEDFIEAIREFHKAPVKAAD